MTLLSTATDPRLATDRAGLAVATQNIRTMHFLARLAKAFNDANVPVMVLKGAALQLTVYESPTDRQMCDLDLLIKPSDIDRAFTVLESLGAYRSQILMREDFFPKYYYEAEYTVGDVMPVVMDVHIRPLRPLRYVQFMPDDALWENAQKVQIGDSHVYLPCPEEMLIHMTAHLAVHGDTNRKWREDICRWSEQFADQIDWQHFVDMAQKWRLTLPVVAGIEAAQVGNQRWIVPQVIFEKLLDSPVNWRDRLCLRQAPRDDDHPTAHVLVNAMVTPGIFFVLGYLFAALIPGKEHMREWYGHEHTGWLPVAHVCRLLRPVTKYFDGLWAMFSRTRIVRDESGHPQLTAARDIDAGKTVGHFTVRAWDGQAKGCVIMTDGYGESMHLSIKGKMRFVGSSEKPNAKFDGYRIVAIKRIRKEDVITVGVERASKVTGRKKQATPQTLQKAA